MASYGGAMGGLTSGAGLGTRIGVAFVSLTTDNSDLRRGFAEAQSETAVWARKYGTTVGSSLNQASRQLTAVGSTITRRISLPLALAGGAATSYAAKFDQAMTQTVALSNVAANRLGYFTDRVKQLSEETGQDAVELAHTLYFVGSAGLKTSQILPVLTLAAKGATAGLGSAADIGQILTSALNAYHGTALTAAKATDVLVEAIRQGKAEPQDFAQTLGSVIPIAAQLGISFDQVAAAVATATNYGVDANRAVTGLRYALVNMEKPTDKAKEIMGQYGLSVGQIQKSLADPNIGLLKTFQMLADTFDLTTVKGREAWGQVTGGVRASILLNTLVGQNFKRNQQIFTDVGAAAKTGGEEIGKAYDIMLQTPARQFAIAWNKIKLAAIDAGGAILPVAERIISMVGDAASAFAHFPGPVQQAIVGIGLFLVALGPVAVGLGHIGQLVAMIGARAAGAFNALAGGAARPLGATEALTVANTELTASTTGLEAAIDRLAVTLSTTLPAAAEVGTAAMAEMTASEAAAAASGFGYYQAGTGSAARWRNASGTIVSNAEAEGARASMIAAREAAAAERDLAIALAEQEAAAVSAAGASETLAGVLGIQVPAAAARGTAGLEGFVAAQSGLLVPDGEASVQGLAAAMGLEVPAAAARGSAAVEGFVATETGLMVPGPTASVEALAGAMGLGVPAGAERGTLALGEFIVAENGLLLPAPIVSVEELGVALGTAIPLAAGRGGESLGFFEVTESGLLAPTVELSAAVDELAVQMGVVLPAAAARADASLVGFRTAAQAGLVPNFFGAGATGATSALGGGAAAGGGIAAEDAALVGGGGALAGLAGLSGVALAGIFAAAGVAVASFAKGYRELAFDARNAAGEVGLTVNQVQALEDQYKRGAVQFNPFGDVGDKVREAGTIYDEVLAEAVKAGIPLEVAQRKLNAGWAEAVDQIGGLTGSMPAFRQQLQATLGLAESPEADAFRQLVADLSTPLAPQAFGGRALGPGGFPLGPGREGAPVAPLDQGVLSPGFISSLLPPPVSTTDRGVYGGRGGAPTDASIATTNAALAQERTNLLAVTDAVNAAVQSHVDLSVIVKSLGFAAESGRISWEAYYAILKQIGVDIPLAKLGEWGRLIRETSDGTDSQRASLAGLVTQMQSHGVHLSEFTQEIVRSALASGDWKGAITALTVGLKQFTQDALAQHVDDLSRAEEKAIGAKIAAGDYAGAIRLLTRDMRQVNRELDKADAKHDVKVEAHAEKALDDVRDLSGQLAHVEGDHEMKVTLKGDQAALRGLRNLRKLMDDLPQESVIDTRIHNAATQSEIGRLPMMSPQEAAQYRTIWRRVNADLTDYGKKVEETHKIDVDTSRAQADLAAFVRAWSNGRIVIGVDVNPGGDGSSSVPTGGGRHGGGREPVHVRHPHQAFRVGGAVRRMHDGGAMWGDEVPVIAHTEEFIVRSPVARRNENYLRYLNRNGRPPEAGGRGSSDDAVMRLAAAQQAQIDDVSSAVRELAHAIAKGGVHMDGHKVGTLLKREDRRRMGM